MKTGNGNAPRDSATSSHVAERSPHRGRSLNIANLPSQIRDELNYRITDGEQGNELVAWLNAKPEVIKVIRERFDGTPISEQNLSEWRKRGYQKWLAHRNFVDESNALSDNTADIAETGIDCDKLLLTLTAAYAEATQNWIITPGEQMLYKLAVYKKLTNGVIALRRAEIQKVRLEIERERLELLREKRCNRSDSSSSAPVSSSAESPTTSQAIPKEESERGKVVPSPTPSTASPRSAPPANQAPPAGASSPSPKSAEPPAKSMPPASMPVTQPPPRPTPAYRDPRSRYSLA
jgi:hypothetical protein